MPKDCEKMAAGIPIRLPGLTCMTVSPIVYGPDNVPAVTSVAEASQDVVLALLSARTAAPEAAPHRT